MHILTNSDDKLDENRNYNDASNHLLSSSDFDVSSFKSMLYQKEKRKPNNKVKQFEKTKIVQGEEGVFQTVDKVYFDCKNNYDACIDKTGPSLLVDIPLYRKAFSDLKKKNVKIRFVTDVSSDNIIYCKQLIREFNADIRHLANTKGNFGISDNKEYVATAVLYKNKPVTELIYSNVKEVVEQNQFIFETLWKKAMPAEHRIREIEEGIYQMNHT